MTGPEHFRSLSELDNLDSLEWGTIDRFLAEELTPADESVIQGWNASNPEAFDTFVALRKALRAQSYSLSETAIRERAAAVREMESAYELNKKISTGQWHSRFGLRRWASSVSAVAAAVMVAVFVVNYIPTRVTQPQTKTYSTRVGQRATVTLNDGSQVTLAPVTTIRVSGRNVTINGEALFTITNHTSSPFTITARATTIRVLGTTFSVRSYQNDPSLRVVVAEGKVAVRDAVIASGDAAQFSPNGTVLHMVRNADIGAEFGWAQGKIVFRKTPVVEAFKELERFYGVTFVAVSSSITDRHITGTLDNMPLETAIASLERLLSVRARRVGSTITLKEL